MEKHWVHEIFKRCGAILEGHFVFTSGRHSGKYLEKALVYPDTMLASDLCYGMAVALKGRHSNADDRIEAVVGPAEGGIIISHRVAENLRSFSQEQVLALFTEKNKKGKQVLKRRFRDLVAGKRVAVVDDILTTGGSVKQVIREVEKAGGQVVAVVVICNRGGVTSEDIGGYPLFSLWEVSLEDWAEEDCPLCKDGIPVDIEIGKGKEFLSKKTRPVRNT